MTPGAGLMNPNHHLAACIAYLFGGNRDWSPDVGVGKTLVSSGIIDRVAADLGRPLVEVPVGFKWFVDGLVDGSLGFGGEESAGASFLRRDGSVWSTDKDGLIPCLLAAEMTARGGADPGEVYRGLAERFGDPVYQRVDVAAGPQEKEVLKALSPEQVKAGELAGEPIVDVLTAAPGNGAPIGGVKVVAEQAWFAARPSGTEDVYKVYAESFLGPEHLERILAEAEGIVHQALEGAAANDADGRGLDWLRVFAGYRIEGVAGEGGMGRVYRATQIGAEAAGGAQADRAGAGRRPGLPGPLRARVRAGGVDRAPQRDPGLRGRRRRGPAVHRHALGRGHRPALDDRQRGPARAQAAWSRSSPRWARRSTPRTATGWCTATSSPRT